MKNARRGSIALLLALCLSGILQAEEKADYQGLWWISHGDGRPLQLRLYSDGSAWSDYPSNNPGAWTVRDGEVLCRWADDWKEILAPVKGGWEKRSFGPGVPFRGKVTSRSRALRACAAPDGWFGFPVK